jgi:tripartite-type tricarboxylate transporter receptor subunit TctC
MKKTLFAALIAALAVVTGAHAAEKFPAHPITIVVPFSAGGPSDAMMRILGERLKVTLGGGAG